MLTPKDGERESVMLTLRQKGKEYMLGLNADFQAFIEEHNPFVRIVAEGLAKS